ncbi:MAG: GNAT superfamily N-acetyltransferase [Paraglaciecola sp.]|jgi:GNAT superfamily N-acetyltransferase
MNITIHIATKSYWIYATKICQLIEMSALERGTGIARRTPEYLQEKMAANKAVIALAGDDLVGFCYIETWSTGNYVANSGLIVSPKFRKQGVAKILKEAAFNHARNKYPKAKVFGITTSLAVMKINSELGYKPVTFSELTQDEAFWEGCTSCPNYSILQQNQQKLCLCTGMLAPSKEEEMRLNLTSLIIKKT